MQMLVILSTDIILIFMQGRSRSRSSSNTSDRNGKGFVEPSKRLYVSGLSTEVTEDELRSLFEKCGDVTDFYLKRNDNSSILFIEFSSQDDADNAIQKMNGKRMNEKMMWVKYANPRKPKEGKNVNSEPNNRNGRSGFGFKGNKGYDEQKQGGNRGRFSSNNERGDNYNERKNGWGNNGNNGNNGNGNFKPQKNDWNNDRNNERQRNGNNNNNYNKPREVPKAASQDEDY